MLSEHTQAWAVRTQSSYPGAVFSSVNYSISSQCSSEKKNMNLKRIKASPKVSWNREVPTGLIHSSSVVGWPDAAFAHLHSKALASWFSSPQHLRQS